MVGGGCCSDVSDPLILRVLLMDSEEELMRLVLLDMWRGSVSFPVVMMMMAAGKVVMAVEVVVGVY